MATRMRIRFASVVVCASMPALASACSIISSFDGLTDGGPTTITHEAGRDAEIIDGSPVTDVGTEAGPACPPGTTMCLPPPGTTDQSSLLECDQSGVEQTVECQYGCVMQASDAGVATAPSPVSLCSPCFLGGKYCGGDKIGTDPRVLYLCNPDGTASVYQNCGLSGCKVNTNGADDQCIL